MPDLTVSALSLVYVHVPVRDVLFDTDPTGDTVAMAFPTVGTAPASNDWNSAAWNTDATTTPPTYFARCLVGPAGTVTLTAGVYDVWVRLTDDPEVPVLRCPHRLIVT